MAVSVGMPFVINATVPFERIGSVYAAPREIRSTGSSSKIDLLGVAFQNGGASISSPHVLRQAELDPAFHCPLGPCTEKSRFNAPTKKSNQRKTEGHQSALLGHHSFG